MRAGAWAMVWGRHACWAAELHGSDLRSQHCWLTSRQQAWDHCMADQQQAEAPKAVTRPHLHPPACVCPKTWPPAQRWAAPGHTAGCPAQNLHGAS